MLSGRTLRMEKNQAKVSAHMPIFGGLYLLFSQFIAPERYVYIYFWGNNRTFRQLFVHLFASRNFSLLRRTMLTPKAAGGQENSKDQEHQPSSPTLGETNTNENVDGTVLPWFRTERAMWRDIEQGFQFV